MPSLSLGGRLPTLRSLISLVRKLRPSLWSACVSRRGSSAWRRWGSRITRNLRMKAKFLRPVLPASVLTYSLICFSTTKLWWLLQKSWLKKYRKSLWLLITCSCSCFVSIVVCSLYIRSWFQRPFHLLTWIIENWLQFLVSSSSQVDYFPFTSIFKSWQCLLGQPEHACCSEKGLWAKAQKRRNSTWKTDHNFHQ